MEPTMTGSIAAGGGVEAGGGTPLGGVVRIDDGCIQAHLDAVVRSTVPKLPSPVTAEASDRELLLRLANFYHETLKRSPVVTKFCGGCWAPIREGAPPQ
jgi:hypothetical protein